ncbi:MAG: polyamine aminopropyltransferase [Deltaproteobacteria bacterium]|nr:polyamine aminopropyltransferase [Deltaproteobacteria bacterium]
MLKNPEWISEKWKNIEIRYRVKEVLNEIQTDFQHLLLVETYEFGKMLQLDGLVQTTMKDEFIYHEMITHVPLLSHPEPEKILIIGGGDGGVLREVLKHEKVVKATMVEIDSTVVEFCKEYLSSINGGAFKDKRTDLVIADGSQFLKDLKAEYDIIIVDSPDPVGPAQILFSEEFYRDIHRALKPGGIMVRQSGSVHLQESEQIEAHKLLKNIFKFTAFYTYTVPTYIGGLFSTVFCSDLVDPLKPALNELSLKFQNKNLETKYYSPEQHYCAFRLPPFMEKRYR